MTGFINITSNKTILQPSTTTTTTNCLSMINKQHQSSEAGILITTIVFGAILNIIVSYFVFYWKQLPWSVCRLVQNIVACNFTHLLTGGIYDILTADVIRSTLMSTENSDCQLVYPILAVSINNPNLITLAVFSYFVYNTRDNKMTDKVPEKAIGGLLVVGWIVSFFMFSPQIFVVDLTQVDQQCALDDYTEIADMRSSYWIGMLYFQFNVFVIACIYIVNSWRYLVTAYSASGCSIRKESPLQRREQQQGESSTITSLLRPKIFTEDVNGMSSTNNHNENFDGNDTYGNTEEPTEVTADDLELVEVRRERIERFVLQQQPHHKRTVTFSDMSDSSSPSSSQSNQLQIRFMKTVWKRRRNMIYFISLLLASHAVGMIPKNFFFFWYYFTSVDAQLQAKALAMHQLTTPLSYVSTLLSPLIFMIMQPRIWIHIWWKLNGRKTPLRNSANNMDGKRSMRYSRESSMRISRTNGILKETNL